MVNNLNQWIRLDDNTANTPAHFQTAEILMEHLNCPFLISSTKNM